jgi:hypothetical protein
LRREKATLICEDKESMTCDRLMRLFSDGSTL